MLEVTDWYYAFSEAISINGYLVISRSSSVMDLMENIKTEDDLKEKNIHQSDPLYLAPPRTGPWRFLEVLKSKESCPSPNGPSLPIIPEIRELENIKSEIEIKEEVPPYQSETDTIQEPRMLETKQMPKLSENPVTFYDSDILALPHGKLNGQNLNIVKVEVKDEKPPSHKLNQQLNLHPETAFFAVPQQVKSEPQEKNIKHCDPLYLAPPRTGPWRFSEVLELKVPCPLPNVPHLPSRPEIRDIKTPAKGPFFCSNCKKRIETRLRFENHQKKCQHGKHKLETRDILKNMKLPY